MYNKMQKILAVAFCVIMLLSVIACRENTIPETDKTQEDGAPITYIQITAAQAKELMDKETGYVILDARTQEEYDESHIPGAILMPEYEVSEKAEETFPDKGQLILVYCRSGRRSKIAAQALADLGYSNVKEFGGIIDWPYEVEPSK